LRVGVQSVAGAVPLLVGNSRPPRGHFFTLPIEHCSIRPVKQADRQRSHQVRVRSLPSVTSNKWETEEPVLTHRL
jgi:hypothetical protein